MQKMAVFGIVAGAFLVLSTTALARDPFPQILYTRRVPTLAPGVHTLRFSLWDLPSGGTAAANRVWYEEKDVTLTTTRLSVYLGTVSDPLKRSGPLRNVDFSVQYFVQIEEWDGLAFVPVGNRTRFNIVPYAFWSATALEGGSVTSVVGGNGLTATGTTGDVQLDVGAGPGISVDADTVRVATGGVGAGMLAAGAVTASSIANDAVTTSSLADGAVTGAKIADSTISSTDMANGSVTLPKINTSGALANQVLSFSGSAAAWNYPSLHLPYSNSVSSASTAFSISNTGSGPGVRGDSAAHDGVVGESDGPGRSGVYGVNSVSGGYGVYGRNTSPAGADNIGYLGGSSHGVYGSSSSSTAVRGDSSATNSNEAGVYGVSSYASGKGVIGIADGASGYGVWGRSSLGRGGTFSGGSHGIYSSSTSGIGVYAASTSGNGLRAYSNTDEAIYATSYGKTLSAPTLLVRNYDSTATEPAGIAVYARNNSGDSTVVVHNSGGGDVIRGFNTAGSAIVYRVSGAGHVTTPVLTITGGSDLSERFDIRNRKEELLKAGMVVSIDPEHPGKLTLSRSAYDRAVAGVISGAGGVKTGMLMGQAGSVADGQHPVALTGRVFVMADASGGAIKPGDMLTTSDTPGHAMRVSDHGRAQGAILGKAMTSLETGRDLVLVLVTLQ